MAISNTEMVAQILKHPLTRRPLKYTDFARCRFTEWARSIGTFTEQSAAPTVLVESGHDDKREMSDER